MAGLSRDCHRLVDDASGGVYGDRKNMRLTIVDEMIPVGKRRAVPGFGLNFAVFAFLLALALVRPEREIHPDPANKCDLPAIGKPFRRVRAGRHTSHASRLATVDRDHIDLRLLVVAALRDKSNTAAIRRKHRRAVWGGVSRQRARLATIERVEPKVGQAFAFGHVIACNRHDSEPAVR